MTRKRTEKFKSGASVESKKVRQNIPTLPTRIALRPGRIISLHNVPVAATDADIRRLLGNVALLEYKRTNNSETSEPSVIAFMLFPAARDAIRAFLTLDGREVMGQEVRVNFVNGVRFESESA